MACSPCLYAVQLSTSNLTDLRTANFDLSQARQKRSRIAKEHGDIGRHVPQQARDYCRFTLAVAAQTT